jgi:hypothetical protein
VEDPDEVLLPSRDLVLVALREDESEHCIPFTLFGDLPLDPRQGSAIEIPVNRSLRVYYWCGLQGQISNRIEDGLVESIYPSSLQSLVEYLAYVTASPPKVDVILIVGHRVLERRESEVHLRRAVGRVVLES